MMVLAVDPEHLRRAAETVRIVATDINSLVRRTSGLAVPGQRTWESAAGLDAAARAFGDHLRMLAAGLDRTAAGLATAVDTLTAADQAAVALIAADETAVTFIAAPETTGLPWRSAAWAG